MKLFYKKIGKGAPVILVHGLFGSSDHWLRVAKDLSEHFEVFMPDMRNHGRSPHDSAMNYYAMAEDLRQFIKFHKISDPILTGHSMGGKIVMQTVSESPNIARGIVVVDMGLKKYPLRHIHYINTMLDVDFDTFSKRSEVSHFFMEKMGNKNVVQLLLKNLEWKNKNRLGWRLNIQNISENIDFILDAINCEQKYTKPALFIRGSNSEYIEDKDIDSIKRCFPSMHLATITDAGHWVYTDNYNAFYNTLYRFLKELE